MSNNGKYIISEPADAFRAAISEFYNKPYETIFGSIVEIETDSDKNSICELFVREMCLINYKITSGRNYFARVRELIDYFGFETIVSSSINHMQDMNYGREFNGLIRFVFLYCAPLIDEKGDSNLEKSLEKNVRHVLQKMYGGTSMKSKNSEALDEDIVKFYEGVIQFFAEYARSNELGPFQKKLFLIYRTCNNHSVSFHMRLYTLLEAYFDYDNYEDYPEYARLVSARAGMVLSGYLRLPDDDYHNCITVLLKSNAWLLENPELYNTLRSVLPNISEKNQQQAEEAIEELRFSFDENLVCNLCEGLLHPKKKVSARARFIVSQMNEEKAQMIADETVRREKHLSQRKTDEKRQLRAWMVGKYYGSMLIRDECASRIDAYIADQQSKGYEWQERANDLIAEYSLHLLHKRSLVLRYEYMCRKKNYDDWGEIERETLLALCDGLNEYHCAWIWTTQPEQRVNLYRLLRGYREILENVDEKDDNRITLITQLEAKYKAAYFLESNNSERLERMLVKGHSEEMIAAAVVAAPEAIEKYQAVLIDGMHHWEPDRAYCAALCLIKIDNNNAMEYVTELLPRICSLYVNSAKTTGHAVNMARADYFFRLLRYTSMIGVGNDDLYDMMVGLFSYFPQKDGQQPRHEDLKVLAQHVVGYFKKRSEQGLTSLARISTMPAIDILFMIGTMKALEHLNKTQSPLAKEDQDLFKVFRQWMIDKPRPEEGSCTDAESDMLDNPFIT